MDSNARTEIRFARPRAFWLGVSAVVAGVGLNIPMYLSARDMGYNLEGMGWDRWMILGMALVIGGLGSVVFGLGIRSGLPKATDVAESDLEALDSSRLSPAHIKLMLVMVLAIAIDTQKPFTFTFILPGVADEYNLASPRHPAPGQLPVALWPFVAIFGTVVGSLVWGHIADRVGRRATILVIATMFMATAVCGAMPSLPWNLVMCFLMGFSVGGLLPIVYSLLTETTPVRRRGQLIVLVAGVGTALGFLLASWSAHWLIPTFGWRIMWFLGVGTGLGLILLNRYIPESPRFLLAQGRRAEADAVMRTFGIVPAERPAIEQDAAPVPQAAAPVSSAVIRPPYRGITFSLVVFGLAWGLANFGFLVWLPSYVAQSGMSVSTVTAILAKAALFSIPAALLVSWLYGYWGSRTTLIASASLTAGTLTIFAVLGKELPRHSALFTVLVAALLVSLWASIAVMAPYSAEVYPTAIRGIGSGVAAGASKLGGVFALGLSVAAIAPPAIAGSAMLAAIPAGFAALMLVLFGIETRGRSLEQISMSVSVKRGADGASLADGVNSPP